MWAVKFVQREHLELHPTTLINAKNTFNSQEGKISFARTNVGWVNWLNNYVKGEGNLFFLMKLIEGDGSFDEKLVKELLEIIEVLINCEGIGSKFLVDLKLILGWRLIVWALTYLWAFTRFLSFLISKSFELKKRKLKFKVQTLSLHSN